MEDSLSSSPDGARAVSSGNEQASQVHVEPGGAHFDVDPKESVIQAAWRAGYQWPSTCWGQAECGVCVMEILKGMELLNPVTKAEATRLRALSRHNAEACRLACQARVVGNGNVIVRKPGVRPRTIASPSP